MMAFLNAEGWIDAKIPSDADVVIINSCGFIEKAKQESINAVLEYRKNFPDKKIILAGCLSERYAADLFNALPEADILFGNKDLSKITEAATSAIGGERKLLIPNSQLSTPNSQFLQNRPLLSLPGSAYVKISEGCNNRCSFCSIPLIRGPLQSRPIISIVDECKALLARGIREICLIGQDIGSFGIDKGTSQLPELLKALSALEGDFWVRLLYIHPEHFPLPILDTISNDSRFLPYFDLPFQHGSNRILKSMNRKQTVEDYLALIAHIRQVLPDAVIRSTFLLGFPGETDEDVQMLLDFQEKARLDWLGCFTYSREENTPAYTMKSRVSKKIAEQRKLLVEEKQIGITEKQMDRFIGRTMDILIEENIDDSDKDSVSDDDPDSTENGGLYLGRLFCQTSEVDGSTVISFDGDLELGSIVRGRVFARAGFDLEASVGTF
jgi:ribosomal protein S12 methylthiotransferase